METRLNEPNEYLSGSRIVLSASLLTLTRTKVREALHEVKQGHLPEGNPVDFDDRQLYGFSTLHGIISAVLGSDGKLVFGGHPTVTPIAVHIAEALGKKDRLVVYQSEWFRDMKTPEIDEITEKGLGTVVWIGKDFDLDRSLFKMRLAMIADQSSSAAIFFGNTAGVQDEYRMWLRHADGVPPVLALPECEYDGLVFDGELFEGFNQVQFQAYLTGMGFIAAITENHV